jgi:uncharacterized membrane protein YheB (UPF0754 family)
VRVEAAVARGDCLALRRHRIAELVIHPSEPVMRLGVLRVVADRVAQVDLRRLEVAFLHGIARGRHVVRRVGH